MSHDKRQELADVLTACTVDLRAAGIVAADDVPDDRPPDVQQRLRAAPIAPTRRSRVRYKRRPRPPRSTEPAEAPIEMLVALLRSPMVFELAEQAADIISHLASAGELPNTRAGRPRLAPIFMHIVFITLMSATRSQRSVQAFLRSDVVRTLIHETLAEAWPDHPERRASDSPMTRFQYMRYRNRFLVHPQVQDRLSRGFEEISADLASRIGLMNEAGGGSVSRPAKSRTFIGDQTVVRAALTASPGDMQLDRDTGEITQIRFDPDARVCRGNDGTWVSGSMWVSAHVRGKFENERVCVAFDQVRQTEHDGSRFVDLVERIRPRFPAAQAATYDMALTHKDIERLFALRLIPVVKTPLTAKGKPTNAKLETLRDVMLADGHKGNIDIWTLNGAPGIEVVARGRPIFKRLEQEALRWRASDSLYGWYRIPNDPIVPVRLRGVRLSFRHDQTAADDARRTSSGSYFKRAHYLKPLPEGTASFDELHGLRQDAESDNNLLKQSLWNKRAHSVGTDRQWVDMLGFHLLRNVKAALAFERRTGVDPFASHRHPPPRTERQAA